MCLRSLGCWKASASFSTGRRDRAQSKSFDEYRKAVGIKSQEEYIRLDAANCAPNYVPTPVVISRGEGVYVWDIDGNKYLDFVAGISSLNQGHCHPRITEALIMQAKRLTLTCRVLHNDCMPVLCKFINDLLGYERTLLMNTGAEAGETAIKAARKWGYEVKGIRENRAKIVFCNNNYWGRTIAAASSSTTPDNYRHFGPYTPGFELIPFDDLPALEKALEDPNVAAFFVEPIQGEGGVIIPQNGYLRGAAELCRSRNVLLIVDEIQAGLGRTGRMLASDWEGVRPDVVLLGKSLTGGTVPCSAVVTNAHVMNVFTPGTHGSTYGGNPLACAVAYEALSVLVDEQLAENAKKQGQFMRDELSKMKEKCNLEWIRDIRGRGLFNAVEINGSSGEAMQLCIELKNEGVLCRPTRGNVLRFLPPLCIDEAQMKDALQRIQNVFCRKTS
ncbi:ornithine aminotransferase, putative [Eimeria tenella]|uniref:Ornithine aminotransferase n=1 Tax=Eimeria tenella TaxID=5802 RepID=U6KNL7_EIMTE|nr:ornithine aminotransferase, putative [Eimeria tenella]CDJ37048.1 ornithine aminotransferase, putative [Eimeria tenella]|eukprot:XP_013227886.1 ornithine aminotransferase, putative [Eimeria tenella]